MSFRDCSQPERIIGQAGMWWMHHDGITRWSADPSGLRLDARSLARLRMAHACMPVGCVLAVRRMIRLESDDDLTLVIGRDHDCFALRLRTHTGAYTRGHHQLAPLLSEAADLLAAEAACGYLALSPEDEQPISLTDCVQALRVAGLIPARPGRVAPHDVRRQLFGRHTL